MTMSRWLDVLRLRLRSLLERDAIDRELQRELRFHLHARVDELIAGGMSATDARLLAQREFG
jgi:putative ABC transport system permease protein